jgi:hypothetical protein
MSIVSALFVSIIAPLGEVSDITGPVRRKSWDKILIHDKRLQVQNEDPRLNKTLEN